MARKHVISKKFVDSQAVSSDFTSDELNVAQTDKGSIHISWASGISPNIDVILQVRNGSTDTWRDLEFTSVPNISGTSGDHDLILNEMPFTDMRLFLDVTSGSAAVTATFTFKSVGA